MYAKDGDQDKLEKATKGMILRQNQQTKENKDKSANAEIEEITIEDVDETEEREKIHLVRSVPKPDEHTIGTKFISPNL